LTAVELRRDPLVHLLDVEREHLSRLRAGLPESRARLQPLGSEREHGRRRRSAEVPDDRVDIRRFPAALATSFAVLVAVHVPDHDEARIAEQAACVAETN